MNKNAERVAAHRAKDDAAKDAKAARKAKMKEEVGIDEVNLIALLGYASVCPWYEAEERC